MTNEEKIQQLETIVLQLQAQINKLVPSPAIASPDEDELNSIIREVWFMKKNGHSISPEDLELYKTAINAGYVPYPEGHPDLEIFFNSEEYLNRSR